MGLSFGNQCVELYLRAARIVYGYAWNTPSTEVQRLGNWRPLKLFYDLKLLSLVFNGYHNWSPLQLQKLFVKRERTYNTRKTVLDNQNPRWTT